MSSDGSFSARFRRLRAGDESEARRVVLRFQHRLIREADRRLGPRLRAKVDPEDVAQSAFASFFARARRGEFSLDDDDRLGALLLEITRHKCASHAERFSAARRDAAKEVSVEGRAAWAFEDVGPTPEEIAVAEEIRDRVLHDLEREDRLVVLMLIEGRRVKEIAEGVGLSERTVGRIRARAVRRLALILDEAKSVAGANTDERAPADAPP